MTNFCVHEKHGGVCKKTGTYCNLGACVYEDLKEFEVVRYGKWIEWNGMDIPENHGRHKCSICGEFAIKPKYGEEILTKRCNNCDAKMDGE